MPDSDQPLPVADTATPQPSAIAEVECDVVGSLPEHTQKLLKIRVPLQVTLASQRKSIQDITELGPGSIIKFDKTCDEPLELWVGNRPLAFGEVVKVGDKFGLRLSGLMK